MKPNFKYFASGPCFNLYETGRSSLSSQLTGLSFLSWNISPTVDRAEPSDLPSVWLASVRYKGSMEVFNLRSELVRAVSALQAPCNVPPADVTVSESTATPLCCPLTLMCWFVNLM